MGPRAQRVPGASNRRETERHPSMGLGQVIGLDIGNTTIKVAEVKATKAGPQVTAFGIAPTPPDTIDQHTILDPATLATTVRELLSSCGARAKHVVSSVAGQQSLVVRIIEVPRMTDKELAETMKWEVERHVPFAQSELQMDYQVINRPDLPPESQTMEVLLVVAQREMITTHLEAVEQARLAPVAIDVEPLALERSLVDIRGPEEMKRTVALVNIGAQLTEISIVRDGFLLFQRTIATAGKTLTQAIADALNVSLEEADQIKKRHAAVDLDAFAESDAAAAFGEGEEAPFGFGAPVFGETAETPAGAEPTLFNPFGADETPAAQEPAAAASPFGTSEPEPEPEPAANPFTASPFGTAESEEETAASPFGVTEPQEETAASPFGIASPFGTEDSEEETAASPFSAAANEEEAAPNPFAPAADAEGEDGFDLSAFGASELVPAAGEAGVTSTEELTPRQVFDIIREPLSDLVTEIKRSLDYFRGRSSDAAIDVVVLSGGTARLPNLDQLLSSELSLPVTVANPFEAVPVQSTHYPEEYVRQIAPLFAVSVGLGLRETVF